MTDSRLRVALLFGGRSAEHEVSILSARSIADAAPPERFEIVPILINREGAFCDPATSRAILQGDRSIAESTGFSFESWARDERVDCVFPIVHGTYGEDGRLQGYLEMLGLPYVGSGVTASAVGMDKWMMKQAFAAEKLPIVEHVLVLEPDWLDDRDRATRAVQNHLRFPFFVKPANAGSSVGITKVRTDEQLGPAIELALRFDEKVVVERGIDAREVEVSVLGNVDPNASVPGEIIPGGEFYDYRDKYIDGAAELVIPAKLSVEKTDEIRQLAIRAFRSIGASGYARVDFFVEKGTNKVFVNEINTIPGFTRISMFPKLWEATELKYPKLIERLIDLAMDRHERASNRLESTLRFLDEEQRLS